MFDVHLEWNRDATVNAGRPAYPIDPDRPSMFTAVKEQLGLQLKAGTAPFDVLIIDSAEKPVLDQQSSQNRFIGQ